MAGDSGGDIWWWIGQIVECRDLVDGGQQTYLGYSDG